jgi:hypothetical protein
LQTLPLAQSVSAQQPPAAQRLPQHFEPEPH